MQGQGRNIAYKGTRDEWLTPKYIVDALGKFDLDPCAPVVRPWDTAAKHYTILDDGLLMQWTGFVWCNPPYTNNQTPPWLDKLSQHASGGIAIIFARTDSNWFMEYVWERARYLLFLQRRVVFYNQDGTKPSNNPGVPSVLVGYGENSVSRLSKRSLAGAHITDWWC